MSALVAYLSGPSESAREVRSTIGTAWARSNRTRDGWRWTRPAGIALAALAAAVVLLSGGLGVVATALVAVAGLLALLLAVRTP